MRCFNVLLSYLFVLLVTLPPNDPFVCVTLGRPEGPCLGSLGPCRLLRTCVYCRHLGSE